MTEEKKATPGLTASGARKASAKSARSRAREFALQALQFFADLDAEEGVQRGERLIQ